MQLVQLLKLDQFLECCASYEESHYYATTDRLITHSYYATPNRCMTQIVLVVAVKKEKKIKLQWKCTHGKVWPEKLSEHSPYLQAATAALSSQAVAAT